MTLAEQRRERITLALVFAIGIVALCAGVYAKTQDNPSMHSPVGAVRG